MSRSTDPFARAAAITAAFYDWEERGRGWRVWPEPVELEPPFRWFIYPHQKDSAPDDARRHTFLSSLLKSRLSKPPSPERSTQFAEEPQPSPFRYSSEVTQLGISLPADSKFSPELPAQFLLSTCACREPLSFEVISTESKITIQFAGTKPDIAKVRQQVSAHFPDAILGAGNELRSLFRSSTPAVVIECGLANEFMQPLRGPASPSMDPLVAIAGAMSMLAQSEVAVLQVLFSLTRKPWAEAAMSAVSGWDGDSVLEDATELPRMAAAKCATPMFSAVVRIGTNADLPERAWQIAQGLIAALTQFSDPLSNELIPLSNDQYSDDLHVSDLIGRVTRRSGMLLNADELAAIVRLPSPAVRVPGLQRHDRRTRAAPAIAREEGILLGHNSNGGAVTEVRLPSSFRTQHVHVVGATGTGKSTLLLNMLCQDIAAGGGVALLDPHGDLVDAVLARIPANRVNDVILVDPADTESPVPFNVLQAHSDVERTLLASDLVAIFRRLSTSWGDQMNSVLGNAVLAFLESDRGGTLSDLRRFLVESEYREAFVDSVRDPEIQYYWRKEFKLLTGRPQAPILTRLDAFLRPKPIRAMVSQTENRLDFAAIMDGSKVFLAKLSHGLIGEENAALLGALFVAKFNQLALGRQAQEETSRRLFAIYIDEFHLFATPSIGALLTGGRKYQVGLTLAHQELRQLGDQDSSLLSAVLSNAATQVCFRVGLDDAKRIAQSLGHFSELDLQNLTTGHAVCRMERSDWDFDLSTMALPKIDARLATETARSVRSSSRERYGTTPLLISSERPAPDRDDRSTPSDQPVSQGNATATSKSRRTSDASQLPAVSISFGRGGAQHKYVQELVRRWAASNGWKAIVEQSVLDGLGSADVVLERDGRRIACEISVTTTHEHEIQNLRKCLAAGFSKVFAVALDPKRAAHMTAKIENSFNANELQSVTVTTVEELFEELQSLQPPAQATDRVLGYRVVTSGASSHASSTAIRKSALARTVLNALRRLGRNRD